MRGLAGFFLLLFQATEAVLALALDPRRLDVAELLRGHCIPITTVPPSTPPKPAAAAFANAIRACADAREWQGACGLLESMDERSLDIRGGLAAAVRACAVAGQWEKGSELIRSSRARGIKCCVAAYTHAIKAAEDAGQYDEAMALYSYGVEDGIFSHWLEDEPLTIDLHGFSVHTAACAIRYVLMHELSNYLESDLRIVTGAGRHSTRKKPVLLPRIKQLLSEELQPPLRVDHEWETVCDARDCKVDTNPGCLVVRLEDLFAWLAQTKPYETYVISLPAACSP